MKQANPNAHHHSSVIIPIQFLRGVAASFVVIVHLLDRLAKRGAFPHDLPPWASCFGEIGVATFFTISGFIMLHTTQGEFGSSAAARRFFRRRFVRIIPLYYLTTAISILFAFITFQWSTNKFYTPPSPLNILYSILFIPYINSNGIAQPAYTLGWTLEYEMFFYLIFSISMSLEKKIGILLSIILLCSLIILGIFIPNPKANVGTIVAMSYFTKPVLLYFVAGMLIALMRSKCLIIQTNRSVWLPCGLGLFIMSLGVRFAAPTVTLASIAAAAGAVAAATLIIAKESGSKSLAIFVTAFGDASYSLYLTHSFLLGGIALLAAPLVMQSMSWLIIATIATCIVCFACAWIVWRVVETPLMRLLSKALSHLDFPSPPKR
ncbi:acyltransferase [Novosphingobium sp. SG707]|uniref:acyltransferase family protein n=1 Tax=Novosphingobium sp. SG707 TaxID=2586996 RepID=UPI0014486933|nr:peptidoglycan/LPS O-acetylase OafA/YrhL [Novosphingobium sp. SG707]